MSTDATLATLLERIPALVEAFEQAPAEMRERARALVTAVLELHARGLDRIVELARVQGSEALLAAMRDDEMLAALFALHDRDPPAMASGGPTFVPASRLVRREAEVP